MPDAALAHLPEWESFYVIAGSSAAALTGLMFVVVTLTSEARIEGQEEGVSAFTTPNILHFSAVLLISGILCTPGQTRTSLMLLLGATGLAGIAYAALTTWRMRRQNVYAPVAEDWIWYSIIPLVSYGTLLAAALLVRSRPATALYMIAAVALLLLYVGIHNAWDVATYLVVQRRKRDEHERNEATPPRA